MKKIIFILFACIFCTAGQAASPAEDALSQVKGLLSNYSADQRLYFQGMKTLVLHPDNTFISEPGICSRGWKWLSGEEKEEKVKAVGDYLYNMYIASAAQGVIPSVLDARFIGVTDPLDILYCGYEPQDVQEFYNDNKSAVKQRLSARFKQNLNLVYALTNTVNDAKEKAFITALAASADKRYRVRFVAAPLSESEISESLARSLQRNECIEENEICTYKQTDLSSAIDNPRTSATTTHYYRPARKECEACSYEYCRRACAQPAQTYDGWKIASLYRITARPASGGTLKAASRNGFVSPDGKPYAAWDYHVVALLGLYKNKQWIYAVQDPLLFAEPVPLAEWIKVFDAAATRFYTEPFRRSKEKEELFIMLPADQLENLRSGKAVKVKGVTYQPYPVR